MKVLHPTLLIGPGVAGARTGSRSNPLPSPVHPSQQPEHGPSRRGTRGHEYEMAQASSRPPSSSYTGPPLPPHPAAVFPTSSSMAIPPVKRGRGRPKGKAKAKTSASAADTSSDGSNSTRNSPNLPVPLSAPSHFQSFPHSITHLPTLPQAASAALNANSAGDSAAQVLQDLPPCKPRRGRPPRHEVVPGMGEFTVFL